VAIPLLKTKLYIPPVRPGLVSRPRLVERLNEGLRLGRKLALISAPAGFGKTTLLSEWIASCTRDTRIAWLSLDKGDNDLSQFLTSLVAAIQSIDPKLGEGAWAMMQSPQPPAAEPVLITLINELMERPGSGGQVAPVVLVLDDYHEVTAEPVHDALVYLLDRLPPQMHVLIATRVDPPWPLGRLRARREMTELRAGDLRFAPEETARFLNDVMGLGLSAEDMAALDRRTEGWIAGLQMAALSMRGRDAARTEVFIRTFSGSHRYVLDYLMEEVLDRQEDEIRVFLLQTSILKRLTAPLCDAVLAGEGRGASPPQSDSQTILAWLERANLFLAPLDDERRWYRYHPLFADLLRRRLQDTYPEQVSEAHLRASAWYEGQGSITEAISHALEAADDVRAAYLVERYSGQAFRHGEFRQHRRWVEALPEETVRSRPLLCMGRAWALADDPDATDRAVWWMERALALSATNPCAFDDPDSAYRTDHELISEDARLFHISIARRQADPEEVVALCLEALEALPEQTPPMQTPPAQTLGEEAAFSRGIITFWLAQAYGQLNDREAAERAYAQAEQLGLAVEGHLVALAVAGAQAGDALDRGDLHAVARICRETIASLIQPAERAGERVPGACYAYVGLGSTLVEWNELREAEPLLVQGVELAERVVEPRVQVEGCCALARLHWMQGNYEEAHAWMDKALQACRWDPSYLHALRARIWLAQAEGDDRWLDRAVQWADERVLADPGEYSWELQSLVRVRLAQYRARGEPDLTPVLAVLDGHLEAPAATSSGWQVEVLTLKALLLQALGRAEEAMPPLARALAVAEETGRVLAFLEHGSPMVALLHEAVRQGVEASYARQILAAFEAIGRAGVRLAPERLSPEGTPSAQAALADINHPVEPLSERELEVLRLLRSALPQREIAEELYISINTVRSHVKHIYAKLGVHSRLEAVERAEELGLL